MVRESKDSSFSIICEGLAVGYSGKPLCNGFDLEINNGDYICIVGENGAGKSTLIKTLVGLIPAINGKVLLRGDIDKSDIGYLPQQMQLEDRRTVRQEAELAFAHIHETEAAVERLNRELAERSDYDSETYHTLIERMTTLSERLQLIGATSYQAELERTLLGLGFARDDFDRPTAEFSGGWRMRIELAKLLLRRPDVLLLDEPTNHLDIESIQWLEHFMATSSNVVVLVSHDRAFINNTTRRTLEIELGHIYDYKVKYDEYVQLRRERREQQQRAYENQQKMLADTEAFIERFRYKATKAVQVQSRIKQLARVERIEVDAEDTAMLHLRFPPAPRSGSYPVIAEHLTKRYGDHLVFSDATFTIHRGDKVAFVGKNGEGKSTLVKCIMGEIADYSGTLRLGHNVRIGYFAQNQAQLLDETKTVFETIDYVATGDIRTKIRDILGAFMFGGEASDKKVGVLSGGERSRLAMIRLLLEPVNLLILDEPTNHLDMRSKDVLKEALSDFDGTLIVVSHDREFLDGLVDKVYEFGGGRVREHLGGIYDFLERKRIENLRELERRTAAPAVSVSTEESGAPSAKRSYEEQKEQARKIRRLEKAVADVEREITDLERRSAELEAQMNTPEGAADTSLFAVHNDLQKALSDAMDRWSEASETLDAAKNES